MSGPDGIVYGWRADITDEEITELIESHGGEPVRGWWDQVRIHSLG